MDVLMPAHEVDLLDLTPFEAGADDAVFRILRDDDPLHWNDEPDGPGFWSVTRYEDVKAVASDHELFTAVEGTQIQSRRAEGEGERSIHHLDPPRHSQLRRIVVPHVRPARIRSLEPDIAAVIDDLLDDAAGAGEFDFVARIAAQLPLVMIGRLLGAPVEDCPHLLRWTNQMASEDPDYSAGPQTAVRAREETFTYFRDLEAQRRACPADDLVSVLVAAQLDGAPLNRGQLDAYYLILMVAGNETTRNLLSGAVVTLNDHPDQWALVRREPERIPALVEELVRWVSPVLSMRRTARRDLELHRRKVRAGDKVVMWYCSANRDERVFRDAGRFVADRTPNEHMGFGWGVHACLGAHLARLETRLFLQRLIERDLRVDLHGEPARLRSNFFRGIKRLPVSISKGTS
jgi:cytochrome P450